MSDRLPALVGSRAPELRELMVALGEEPFRGEQVARHLYKRASQTFDQMTDLPAVLRALLAGRHRVSPLEVGQKLCSTDGVTKLLVHNGDRQMFECVCLPYDDRVSCCVSTQVGCPMGCTFCATGLGGFDRNLEVGEIVGQYLLLQSLSDRRIGHVVFMGMGEPMLNLENLLAAMEVLHSEVGLSYRHITVSTVGIAPKMRELAHQGLPVHLALSLHSPFDEVRSRIMPVNRKWPVAEVMDALAHYVRTTGRKATIEYLLIDRLNDTEEQAVALARLVKGMPCVVNLIPFNFVATENGFSRPSRERVRAFRTELERRGVNVTERVERGQEIAAACGQLAGRHTGRFAHRRLTSAPLVSS